jgi:hypothetical protein
MASTAASRCHLEHLGALPPKKNRRTRLSRAAALCESSRSPEGVSEEVSERRTLLVCPSAVPVSRPPRTKKAAALKPRLVPSSATVSTVLARRIITILETAASPSSSHHRHPPAPIISHSRLPSSTPDPHYHQLLLPLTHLLSLPRSHLRSQASHEQWVPPT